jgi:hypothetical protein
VHQAGEGIAVNRVLTAVRQEAPNRVGHLGVDEVKPRLAAAGPDGIADSVERGLGVYLLEPFQRLLLLPRALLSKCSRGGGFRLVESKALPAAVDGRQAAAHVLRKQQVFLDDAQVVLEQPDPVDGAGAMCAAQRLRT